MLVLDGKLEVSTRADKGFVKLAISQIFAMRRPLPVIQKPHSDFWLCNEVPVKKKLFCLFLHASRDVALKEK